MPYSRRAVPVILSLVVGLLLVVAPAATPAQAAGEKVVIIVGPVGSLTDRYRSMANEVATAATEAGATVVKVYSPQATWPKVMAAVVGANIIVYFGHGNGSPNPYGTTELTDRSNGWGLNTATTNGDKDSWSDGTLVYCGEKALLGTLVASDGAQQRKYCGGGPIAPASGFTMVYGQAHYAPGFGERYVKTDPLTTLAEAQARVRNYSYPVLQLGAGAFFATAYGDADEIVSRVLTQPDASFGDIFALGRGYSPTTLTAASHADIPGAQTWVQRTTISSMHFGQPDYWYAFAGDPGTKKDGTGSFYGGYFSDIWTSGFRDDIVWLAASGVTSGCSAGMFCPRATVTREQMASFLVRGLVLPATATDFFVDDDESGHEADINRLAASGITGGCAEGRFCPRTTVTREQMASFLVRGLGLPATATDFFADDDGSAHEADINRLAASGITGGCADGKFCPRSVVTREQMAAFLHRALGR